MSNEIGEVRHSKKNMASYGFGNFMNEASYSLLFAILEGTGVHYYSVKCSPYTAILVRWHCVSVFIVALKTVASAFLHSLKYQRTFVDYKLIKALIVFHCYCIDGLWSMGFNLSLTGQNQLSQPRHF